jgi:hypothetical protein
MTHNRHTWTSAFSTLRTIARVARRVKNILKASTQREWVPPGHYYSPIPSLAEIRKKEQEIFGNIPAQLPGIDLNPTRQLEWIETFAPYYQEMPYHETKQKGLRYYLENEVFAHADGIILHCLIRHLRPKRIIEVGSGFSSCVILDANERYFENQIKCTFIEPFPERFLSLIKDGDRESLDLLSTTLQDADVDLFRQLGHNDILFVDSTHVSKVHSDVNWMFFHVLPTLANGVYVHFHDIFYPFEYPKEWVYQGRAWNEAYLLRAFLQYNAAFSIQFFNSYLSHFHRDRIAQAMPLCLKNPGGSIWLRRS